MIFLLISVTTSATTIASGQQKNHPTSIENLNKTGTIIKARATKYYAHERVWSKKKQAYVYNSDKNTDKGKTAAMDSKHDLTINEVRKMGLEVLSVNPSIIPYGSVVLYTDNTGTNKVGVAIDTGSAVKSAKASGGRVPVIDIYTSKDQTGMYHHFTVVKYHGPNFKMKLTSTERTRHIQKVRDAFVGNGRNHQQLLVAR